MQLQDARIKHQDLKAQHDQLALTLEDHKSALASAQMQVDQYKQLSQQAQRDQNAQAVAVAAKPHVQETPCAWDTGESCFFIPGRGDPLQIIRK
ncbi:hypothetical protein CRUP_034784 [Coryphaenoides rupestris]|nr:hypothetical protein CRUP_034784 [Coryphaenoides rupestris]